MSNRRSVRPSQPPIIRVLNEPDTARHRESIETLLSRANGERARGVIRTHAEVVALTDRVEDILAMRGVPKQRRAGTTLHYIGPYEPPPEYQDARYHVMYPAPSTMLILYRNTSSWSLIAAQATSVWPGAKESFQLRISVNAATSIVRTALENIQVDDCSVEVTRDLALNARDHWYALGSFTTNIKFDKHKMYENINTDIRIIGNDVHITPKRDGANDFALYSKNRDFLAAAMVTCRITYKIVRFSEIKNWTE